MPNKGEVRLIRKTKRVWVACVDCGKERWVNLGKGKPIAARCKSCASKHRPPPTWNYFKSGKDNIMWNGGRRVDRGGYVGIRINDDSPYFEMVNSGGYVAEHRLVMAKHLGRCLTNNEHVHHKDRNKHNNNIENLELLNKKDHYPSKHFLDRIRILEEEVARLKGIMTLEKTRTLG